MTIELYRPGVEKPIVLQEETKHEVYDKNGNPAVLVSLRANEGFKEISDTFLPNYLDMNDTERKEAEEMTSVYKSGSVLQLADGLIAMAT